MEVKYAALLTQFPSVVCFHWSPRRTPERRPEMSPVAAPSSSVCPFPCRLATKRVHDGHGGRTRDCHRTKSSQHPRANTAYRASATSFTRNSQLSGVKRRWPRRLVVTVLWSLGNDGVATQTQTLPWTCLHGSLGYTCLRRFLSKCNYCCNRIGGVDWCEANIAEQDRPPRAYITRVF